MTEEQPEEESLSAHEVLTQAFVHSAAEALGSGGAMVTGILAIVTFIDRDGDKDWSVVATEGGGGPIHFIQGVGMSETLQHFVRQGAFGVPAGE
jgi:hypothetical protein